MADLRKTAPHWFITCLRAAAILTLWLISQSVQITFAPVYSNLSEAITFDEGGFILISAILLVLNNACRAILLYTGWFMLADGLGDFYGSLKTAWLLPPVAIPVSYFGIAFLHFPSVPHFGVPAVITLVSVWLLKYLSRDVSRPGYKFAVQAMVVFSIQWLDLVPLLTPYGFGWGELSSAIKSTAVLMDKQHLLNTVCGLMFVFNSMIALLLTKLFVSYEKQLSQLRVLRSRERELARMRTEQTRMRLYQEMQYLVHDLKRPLTTVLGLADLLSISEVPRTVEYSRKILTAAEKMDQMIGELRNPDSVRVATVEEIVVSAMSQVRVLPWGSRVTVELPQPLLEKELSINVIRFSRVLVNLLDNGWHAVSEKASPLLKLSVEDSSEGLSFIIEDNGCGFIEPPEGEKSSWGSSGLGLSFARAAVKNFGGTLSLEPRSGGGLLCRISLPERKGGEK